MFTSTDKERIIETDWENKTNIGYKGTEEPRDWIADSVTEYFPSFFAYWKNVEKQLYKSV